MTSSIPLVQTGTKPEVVRSRRKRNACEMEYEGNGSSSSKHGCSKNGPVRGPPPDNYSRTDLIFLVVFPLLFILFNLCYWTTFYVWRYGFNDEDDFVVNTL